MSTLTVRSIFSTSLLLSAAVVFAMPGRLHAQNEVVTVTSSAADERRNVEAVHRFYEDVFNRGDTAVLDEIVSENYIEHAAPTDAQVGLRDSLKRFISAFRSAFPDLKTTVEHVVAKGNIVFVHYRQTGTSKGEFMGMPATGRSFDIRGVDVVRMENGRAVEHWGYGEEMKMMSQVGWAPEQMTGAAPAAAPSTE